MSADSIAYYNQNASTFFAETRDVDMEPLRARFLSHVRSGGRILDAGCGSGRDSLYFKKKGYSVMAFDAARELAALASKYSGIEVQVMTFDQLSYRSVFDGIWACASLLHVPQVEMHVVFDRMTAALRKNGILYASFKYGTAEREKDGRLFNDFDEAKVNLFLRDLPRLRLLELWRTCDARPDRNSSLWLNLLLQRSA